MKINEIPKFFRPPNYDVTMGWSFIEKWLQSIDDDSKAIPGALGLDLNPDFQRGHVWSEDKQIAYVEFCLRGGQSSRTILWNHPGWMTSFKGAMTLVDGKQRLEAARKFIHNELPVFGGNRLQDFDHPENLLRSGNASFNFAVNNLQTRAEILEWYLQLNDGGVVHTAEEIQKVKNMLKLQKAYDALPKTALEDVVIEPLRPSKDRRAS